MNCHLYGLGNESLVPHLSAVCTRVCQLNDSSQLRCHYAARWGVRDQMQWIVDAPYSTAEHSSCSGASLGPNQIVILSTPNHCRPIVAAGSLGGQLGLATVEAGGQSWDGHGLTRPWSEAFQPREQGPTRPLPRASPPCLTGINAR